VKPLALLAAAAALVLALFGCSEEPPTGLPGDPVAADHDQPGADGDALRISADPDAGVARWMQTYEIVVENLTPATGAGASQPFSPPVLATHRRDFHVYRAGTFASDELAQIAEDAVSGPMIDLLENSDKVVDVVAGDAVILPGGEGRYEIRAAAGKRWLSAVFMLVNTNDAFGGLDGVRLPLRGEKVYYVHAYDAGSELNSELAADIPGPCCGNPGQGTATNERIATHAGIQGTGDLDPAVYGWSEPVAKVTVRRINPTYEITVENLTPETVPGGSQPFSPPILASHHPGFRIYRVGGYASDELSRIAEDGDNGPLAALLAGERKVHAVVTGGGVILPGGSATYQIEAEHAFARLSVAFMLVNTNDAFSGVSRLRLPSGGSVSYYLKAYDAGGELNTELASDIPGPCCGSPGEGTDEHRRIRHHEGISGAGDLAVGDYGWTDPAAKLTVRRIK
jgi:hypothetical protein